jgi:hypothetical protein
LAFVARFKEYPKTGKWHLGIVEPQGERWVWPGKPKEIEHSSVRFLCYRTRLGAGYENPGRVRFTLGKADCKRCLEKVRKLSSSIGSHEHGPG